MQKAFERILTVEYKYILLEYILLAETGRG
jgi:hypothetical protein